MFTGLFLVGGVVIIPWGVLEARRVCLGVGATDVMIGAISATGGKASPFGDG